MQDLGEATHDQVGYEILTNDKDRIGSVAKEMNFVKQFSTCAFFDKYTF